MAIAGHLARSEWELELGGGLVGAAVGGAGDQILQLIAYSIHM